MMNPVSSDDQQYRGLYDRYLILLKELRLNLSRDERVYTISQIAELQAQARQMDRSLSGDPLWVDLMLQRSAEELAILVKYT